MKKSNKYLIILFCSILVLGGCKESSMRAAKWLFAGPDEERESADKMKVFLNQKNN